MRYPVPGRCPVCGQNLYVTKLACAHCGTAVEGSFELPSLARLSPEQHREVAAQHMANGRLPQAMATLTQALAQYPEDDELFILQPTRVVKRKGIEHAIELVHRLGRKAKLVISHASGDEGHDYERRLRDYSRLMGVNTIFVSDIIDEQRGTLPDGRKVYTLEDIYPHADLVTYPSTFEGFGNAFLEAIYFRKPIVVNIYSIYARDIKPKGFSVIEIDGYVTGEAVELTGRVLKDDLLRQQMVDHNYALATEYYSYTVLHMLLKNLIAEQPWFAKR